MNYFAGKAVQIAAREEKNPRIPPDLELPVPSINKAELYLSFHGNDCCAHCITFSGPHRKETLSPSRARRVLRNMGRYSVITRLQELFGDGAYVCDRPPEMRDLDTSVAPPPRLSETLNRVYANCLMGKGASSEWRHNGNAYPLPFGRPSIRFSGGEFSTWPHHIDGKPTTAQQRLDLQTDILREARTALPEYDLFILTNGRFAVNAEIARRTIDAWAQAQPSQGDGRIRLCISVDVFHRPPAESAVEKMLERIWTACRECNLSSPYLYGISSRRIGLIGRALMTYANVDKRNETIRNVSGSDYVDTPGIALDPVDLVCSDGCNEVKGFLCPTPQGAFPVNNIVVNPDGRLAYCCACVGDYGDFVDSPCSTLSAIIRDPISMMLRKGESAAALLGIAASLDPTIKTFGAGPYAAATGSTCYQMLSGIRGLKESVPERPHTLAGIV
jgi:hypothetical protein